MRTEQRTKKWTMGWILAERSSTWFSGGEWGSGNLEAARVEMKIAPAVVMMKGQSGSRSRRSSCLSDSPTPIGPKWPTKRASLRVWMSGTHL